MSWPSGLGELLPVSWRAAYDAHPRHLFLPDRVWVTLDEPLDRAAEPSRWLAYAYSDLSGAAVGCIVDWASFMRLRAQRPVIPGEPDDFDTIADRGRTDVDLADLLGEHARFGIGLRVPDCRLSWDLGEDGYLCPPCGCSRPTPGPACRTASSAKPAHADSSTK